MSLDTPPKLAGKKRKHYTAAEHDPSVRLTGKLHHYLKEMRKVAKKSKAFEIQRLVKKLKDLRKLTHMSIGDLNDLESQLDSLKKTDHEQIAHLALSSKIRKDKILASNNVLMASLAPAMFTTTNANTQARHVKVESRLLSSKILAAEAQEAVKGLRAVLEPGISGKTHGDVRTLEAKDDQEQVGDEENDEKVAVDARRRSKLADGDSSDDGDMEETATLEEVVDDEADMGDDVGWESGSIDTTENVGIDYDDDDDFSSPHKRPKQSSYPSILGPSNPSSSAAASTFLPSLSVGYIKGDSESDIDPSDGETAASGRKNRRGQRARQAIWEKKYGRNAKHLKKQREDVQAAVTARSLDKRPDKGWDGRRHGDPSTSVSSQAANKKRLAQMQLRSHPERHLPSDRPTHPSWEAKRKLKEKEGARILPSQGKKIVFT